MITSPGLYYEFHKERIVSRPGQPLATIPGAEIGPEIEREDAFRRVRAGRDVYTQAQSDAYGLAMSIVNESTDAEGPHTPPEPSPTGRTDVYYRHYHPGNLHPAQGGPGHVFFGARGDQG